MAANERQFAREARTYLDGFLGAADEDLGAGQGHAGVVPLSENRDLRVLVGMGIQRPPNGVQASRALWNILMGIQWYRYAMLPDNGNAPIVRMHSVLDHWLDKMGWNRVLTALIWLTAYRRYYRRLTAALREARVDT